MSKRVGLVSSFVLDIVSIFSIYRVELSYRYRLSNTTPHERSLGHLPAGAGGRELDRVQSDLNRPTPRTNLLRRCDRAVLVTSRFCGDRAEFAFVARALFDGGEGIHYDNDSILNAVDDAVSAASLYCKY